MPQIVAREFICLQQLFTQLLNETGNYTGLVLIIVEVLNQFFRVMNSNGSWDSRVAHPADIVHHEMDSVVRNHHVYTFVWSPVIEQLILEKEPAGQCTR